VTPSTGRIAPSRARRPWRPSTATGAALLHEWIANPNLRKHCYAVEAAMRAYARQLRRGRGALGPDRPDPRLRLGAPPERERHPMQGVEVLRAAGWPDDICRAVLGHATYSGVPRDTLMAQALFACDELSGFLVACALVTPEKKLAGVEVDSVKKKMKRAEFART
jgi:predicted hydrolase (HD superfamily)